MRVVGGRNNGLRRGGGEVKLARLTFYSDSTRSEVSGFSPVGLEICAERLGQTKEGRREDGNGVGEKEFVVRQGRVGED